MKTKSILMMLAASLSMGFASCSDDDDSTPVIAVTDIVLDQTELTLETGATAQLVATITPAEADADIEWTSSDDAVVTVDDEGTLTAVAVGQATVSAKAGDKTASCAVTVKAPLPAPVIGDFYYSDGTWSGTLDQTKTCIGVVFWAGDPTASDAALLRDHPGCTHGLVIALDEENPCSWQKNYEAYGTTVSSWVKQNATDYAAPESTNELGTPFQTIIGYNNTKALEAFNAAAENSQRPVTVVEKLLAYRTSLPAPTSSSDWYVPSPKELSLLVAGEIEGNIYVKKPGRANMEIVEPKITEAGGAIGEYYTWSSTEYFNTNTDVAWEMAYTYILYPGNWPLSQGFKANDEYGACRFVLAF